jgi:spore coat polysaccharide biosynthesis predicted glycosyltransferase SpsG
LRGADEVESYQPALLLLDSYTLDPVLVRERAAAQKLVVMHDVGSLPPAADLIVTSDPRLAGTRKGVVGGPMMTCVGPMFWGLPEQAHVPERVRSVLVTTGGGDPGDHAVAVAVAIREALSGAEVRLVRGPNADFSDPAGIRVLDQPRSLLGPLLEADLVVAGAGESLREALAAGRPTVALVVAENQRVSAQVLADHGATELFAPDSLGSIVAAVVDLAADRELRELRVRRGRDLIDGHGALRVGFLVWRLINEPARTGDGR